MLTANFGQVETNAADVLELNDALDRLAALDERQVRVEELRYFAGVSVEETADALRRFDGHGEARLDSGGRLADAPTTPTTRPIRILQRFLEAAPVASFA